MSKTLLRIALAAAVLTISVPASLLADDAEVLDSLTLYGGESVRVEMVRAPGAFLRIADGSANRVPVRDNLLKSAVKLDISGRRFTVRTNALRLTISGARAAAIAGIEEDRWGTLERPAVYIDRDCVLTLSGNAGESAVIEVHPLAIATVDARSLYANELMIVGSDATKVRGAPGVKVSFVARISKPETRTSGSSDEWLENDGVRTSGTPQPSAPAPAAASDAPAAAPGTDAP